MHEIPGNLPAFAFQIYVQGNGKWGLSYVHGRAAQLFGLEPEPLDTAVHRFAERIVPEDQDRFYSTIRNAALSRSDWSFEGKRIKPDGQMMYFRGFARPRPAGGATLYDGIVIDISDQWRAAQQVRESEELYRELFEVESDALVLVESDSGRILAANNAASELYGYTREELLLVNRTHLSAEPEKTVEATTTAKLAFTPLRWHRKKNGSIFPVEIANRYFLRKGRPVFVSAIRDITNRRRMQEALEKSEEKFSKAFHSNPAATMIVDLDSRTYIEVNETYEQITGYSRDEVVGRSWDDYCIWIDPDDRDRAVTELLERGKVRDWEFPFRRKSGEPGRGLISAELIEIHGRNCAITAMVDITERTRLESELRQVQKMESVGRLAGGVAHDFNNLLTVINGYSETILGRLDSQDPIYAPAREIQKAGERAAGLTRQLLAFSRKQVIEPHLIDINHVVRDAERMLKRLIGEDIQLITRLDPNLGCIMADPDQMNQVIVNLAVNARDAMPDGGQLEIITQHVDVDAAMAATHPDAAARPYMLLAVTDNGAGIPEEILPSIFDPFFTTRGPESGTGLGLATVYGIVHQSCGWIDVSSAMGYGTTFRIYLPLIGDLAPAEPLTTPRCDLNGHETVLVVEDQEEVRRLTVAILKLYGYRVLDAADARQALSVMEMQQGKIDLLLTDVILPGINGRELSDRMRVLNPKLKVLFTSGYTADVIARRGVLDPEVAYLPKPFTAEGLAMKVREVLT
jgi:PAS domain S-box-containing protein